MTYAASLTIYTTNLKNNMDDILDIEIVPQTTDRKYYLSKNITGKVNVHVQQDLDIQVFGVRLMYSRKGKIEPFQIEISHQDLARNTSWKKGQVLQFTFDQIRSNFTTYQGKNAKITWQLETYLEFTEATRSSMQVQHLKQFKLLKSINPEKQFLQTLPIIIAENRPIIVPFQQGLLQFRNEYLSIYSVIIFVLIIIASFATLPWYFYVIILAIIGLVYLVQVNLHKLLFGSIRLDINKSTDNIIPITLTLHKNSHFLKQIQSSLEVVEIVTDRRGTSDAVYRRSIYVGEFYKVTLPRNQNHHKLVLPSINVPLNFKDEDIEITWEVYFLFELKIGFDLAMNFPLHVTR